MHKGGILCFALVVALAQASPLALDAKQKESQAPVVVDVPAGIFDPVENSEKDAPPADTPAAKKDEAKIEEIPNEKATPEKNDTEKEGEDVPTIFGVRFPSIVIFRRPAVIRDPFAGFQSPFFSRRPSIFSPSIFDDEDRDTEVVKGEDQKPLASSTERNDTRFSSDPFNGMVNRMHQQISSLFSSIFNPNTPLFSRPTFSRPTFSRPSIFSPFSPSDSDEDNVDFDKLPENYSNSTSETKVVDGQLVTVNKTIHKVSGNNSNGFFQFQVIKIRPGKPEGETTVTPVIIGHEGNPPPPESEAIIPENHSASSTPKNPEIDPMLNEVDRPEDEPKETSLSQKEMETKYDVGSGDSNQEQTIQEEVKIVPFMPAKLIKAPNGLSTKKASDLSSDIRVNNMMAENMGNGKLRSLYDPDEVEVFDV